jgi:hypothetical protein
MTLALLPATPSPKPRLYDLNASAENTKSPAAPSSSRAVRDRVGQDSVDARTERELEFAPYRRQTIWLLRRYFRTSLQIGRLPGILGREFFRSRVSSRKACTFEDEVIFATDLDRCVSRLDAQEKYLVGALVMQEYDQEQLAQMTGMTRKWVRFHFYRAIDRLTRMFLVGGYICPKPGHEAAEILVKGQKGLKR